ncbi:hypothetical protein Nizo2814_1005 [Lactiplantibacillus plantarum]|nr:hypothetical protein Nizo2814_1005 [Lactiplantibacillus plantarum]
MQRRHQSSSWDNFTHSDKDGWIQKGRANQPGLPLQGLFYG